MVGLIDLAPRTETVDVEGKFVTVFGVSAKGLADLLARFPETLNAQTDLLAAILRLTLPKGIGPFVEKLTALGSLLGAEGAPSATAPDTKSRKPSTR